MGRVAPVSTPVFSDAEILFAVRIAAEAEAASHIASNPDNQDAQKEADELINQRVTAAKVALEAKTAMAQAQYNKQAGNA